MCRPAPSRPAPPPSPCVRWRAAPSILRPRCRANPTLVMSRLLLTCHPRVLVSHRRRAVARRRPTALQRRQPVRPGATPTPQRLRRRAATPTPRAKPAKRTSATSCARATSTWRANTSGSALRMAGSRKWTSSCAVVSVGRRSGSPMPTETRCSTSWWPKASCAVSRSRTVRPPGLTDAQQDGFPHVREHGWHGRRSRRRRHAVRR